MDTTQLFAAQQEKHVETKPYIVQSPMALGLESPKVNLPIAGEPKQFSLSDEEVAYLKSLVPNIKIVPVAPVEAQVVSAPTPAPTPAPAPVIAEAPATVTSKSMTARQAIEYIGSHTQEELEGFLDVEETRAGVKAAWAEKFPPVTEESTEETSTEEQFD